MWIMPFLVLFCLSPILNAEGETGEGELIVHIRYHGLVPPSQEVRVTRNPDVCGLSRWIQPIIVEKSTGGVKNAILTIEGLPPTNSEIVSPPPVILTNRECRFWPLATPIRVGETVEIRNEDPVMHNTHITNDKKTLLNITMLATTPPVVKIVKKPGIYTVKCDAHTFMKAYMIATDHPYLAISDGAGETRLTNVPAGRHTITVWHDRLGTIQKQVDVSAHKSTVVSVVFPDQAGTNSEHSHP